jgi:hypothetical protein
MATKIEIVGSTSGASTQTPCCGAWFFEIIQKISKCVHDFIWSSPSPSVPEFLRLPPERFLQPDEPMQMKQFVRSYYPSPTFAYASRWGLTIRGGATCLQIKRLFAQTLGLAYKYPSPQWDAIVNSLLTNDFSIPKELAPCSTELRSIYRQFQTAKEHLVSDIEAQLKGRADAKKMAENRAKTLILQLFQVRPRGSLATVLYSE